MGDWRNLVAASDLKSDDLKTIVSVRVRYPLPAIIKATEGITMCALCMYWKPRTKNSYSGLCTNPNNMQRMMAFDETCKYYCKLEVERDYSSWYAYKYYSDKQP